MHIVDRQELGKDYANRNLMDLKLLDVGIFNTSNLEFSKTYLNSEEKELSLLVRNKVPFSIGIEKAAFEPF